MIAFIKKHRIFAAAALFLVAIGALIFINPREIVEYIGVENSYLVVFLLAAIGGLSSITGASFITAIATFSAGGANPWLLGLLGGIGIFISDSIFFNVIQYGKKIVPEEWQSKAARFAKWAEIIPARVTLVITYILVGLVPFPSDILMIALVASGFSYRRVAPVLFLGAITFATLVAFLAKIGLYAF